MRSDGQYCWTVGYEVEGWRVVVHRERQILKGWLYWRPSSWRPRTSALPITESRVGCTDTSELFPHNLTRLDEIRRWWQKKNGDKRLYNPLRGFEVRTVTPITVSNSNPGALLAFASLFVLVFKSGSIRCHSDLGAGRDDQCRWAMRSSSSWTTMR